MNVLAGYKTYIVAVGMILVAVGPALMNFDVNSINIELLLEGLGLGALRKGVASI